MKTIYQILVIILVTALSAVAQQTQGLKIGDKVPDLTLNHIFNYSSPTAHLSDFKGKLIIIDFFNSRCAPCIGSMPSLQALQGRFRDKLVILPVTYEKIDLVLKVLKKTPSLQKVNLPIVYLDTALKKLFPHYFVPHEIIIDGNRNVLAITGSESVNDSTINALLQKKTIEIYTKVSEKPINISKPLFMEDKGQKPIYYFLLTEHYDREISQSSYLEGRTHDGATRYVHVNGSLLDFYRQAFYKHNSYAGSFPRNRFILNVKDTSRFVAPAKTGTIEYRKWYNNNSYCLDLKVPKAMSSKIYDCLKEELDKNFMIKSSLEMRQVKCYAIKSLHVKEEFRSTAKDTLSDMSRLQWTLRNIPISHLLETMNIFSNNPIINGTGYEGRIDIKLTPNFNDIAVLKRELNNYGLTIEETYQDLGMVVITDDKQQYAKVNEN